jgi:hypothetical protein
MKRRDFVLGSSAVAVGQLMTPRSANAQQGSLPLVRWTRVAPMSSFLQDIVVENGFIYALAHLPIDQNNPVHRQWSVTQTTIDGQFVHQHQLPQGKYASLGLHGDAIWVHAGTYHDDTGKAQHNQMLLLTENGVEPAARLNPMVNGVLRHAGPSATASLSNNSVDLWRFEGSRLNLAASHTCASKPNRYVETIEPGVGVLSARDGSHITIVEIASGIFRDATISLPEIATAQEHSLRANISETLLGPIITEQGEKESQRANDQQDCSRPRGFGCRAAQ